MIKSERTSYGFRFYFISPITAEETAVWSKEVAAELASNTDEFQVFADFQQCELFPADAKPLLEKGQRCCLEHGMSRSVVVLKDNITAMQLRIVARRTGILQGERYVICEDNLNWEEQAMDWLLHAKEPESHHRLGLNHPNF